MGPMQQMDRRTRLLVVRKLRSVVVSNRVLTKKAGLFLKVLLFLGILTDVTFQYIQDYLVDLEVLTQDELNALIKKHSANPQ